MSTLLKDIFTIPENANASDYVLRLTASVGNEATETLKNYVVTPDLAAAFNTALGLITEALNQNTSRAAFLTGSFGSGKSHFMAILHAICTHHPQLDTLDGLTDVLKTNTPHLHNKKILPLTFHMLDKDSIEQGIFDGYLRTIQDLHPDAPLPVLHHTDELIKNAEQVRQRMGDQAFLDGLTNPTNQPASGGWGSHGTNANQWTLQKYQDSIKAPIGSTDRQNIVTALVDNYFSAATHLTDYVSFEDGLDAIASHAKTLGYDAAILFVDELVLWLMFLAQDRTKFTQAAQKITKFVESGTGTRDIPLISFIARQVDLKVYFAETGASGKDRKTVEDAFQHQEGRFANIELSNNNLVDVAHKRLLTPQNDKAKNTLTQSFNRLDTSAGLWQVLLDGINTDERNRGSDKEQFRKTYPFSPALISTLRSLAGVMQRDRTALKVMQNMLVDFRETLSIEHVIPVGDSFDYLLNGDSANNALAKASFTTARTLYSEKLRPLILQNHNVAADTPETELTTAARNDLRLAKTLILSAVATEVPALKGLTAERLAHLNHGAVFAPIPGAEVTTVLTKVRQWAAGVPEIQIQSGNANPTISVQLADVDYTSIIERAKDHDSQPKRQRLIEELIADALNIEIDDNSIDQTTLTSVIWRGTKRDVDICFGNVRDPQALPDDRFEARPNTWRVIIDHPFDDHNHTRSEDHHRLDRLTVSSTTITWLPLHLSPQRAEDVGKLVILNFLLSGGDERWHSYTDHLTPVQAESAKTFLEGNRETLTRQVKETLEECYGLRTANAENVIEDSSGSIVRSLTPQADIKSPNGTNLASGFSNLIRQALDLQYPQHPQFEPGHEVITITNIRKAAEHIVATGDTQDRRTDIVMSAKVLRSIADTLGVGTAASGHQYALTEDTFTPWAARLAQAAGTHPEDKPVTVRDVRDWIQNQPEGIGLPDELSDLVIIAWVQLTRRTWKDYETTIEAPAPGKLQDSTKLIETKLPSDSEWEKIRRNSQLLTGHNPKQALVTPTGFEETTNRIIQWVRENHEYLIPLESSLAEAARQWAIDSPDRPLLDGAERHREVTKAREVLDQLRNAGANVLETLATLELDTGAEHISRTLSTAKEYSEELDKFGWNNFHSLDDNEPSGQVRAMKDTLYTGIRAGVYQGQPLPEFIPQLNEHIMSWMRSENKRLTDERAAQAAASPAGNNSGDDAGTIELTTSARPVSALLAQANTNQSSTNDGPPREQGTYQAADEETVRSAYHDIVQAITDHPGRTIRIEWTVEDE